MTENLDEDERARILTTLLDMADEAQAQINLAITDSERRRMLAVRDTLTELRTRIRDGVANPHWLYSIIAADPLALSQLYRRA